jgi:uncharacterized RDD family membrane protein YckC
MIGSSSASPSSAPHPAWLSQTWLTDEVMPRRVIAWCIDGVLIAILAGAFWASGFVFGLLTLGLGFSVLHLLPIVPVAYHWLSLVSPLSATPGQRAMDLIVRRNEDFGQPTGTEALISVLVFYATLALGMIWLGVALFTERNRTPHDMLSGLVVLRARAFAASELTPRPRAWNMGFGGPSNA